MTVCTKIPDCQFNLQNIEKYLDIDEHIIGIKSNDMCRGNYFTNKYIRAYLNLQAKVIAIELIFFSVTILYFLYSIGIGVQFIARHPINFS